MMAVAERVRKIDERCGPARILATAARLLDWVQNYKAVKSDEDFTLATTDLNPALAVTLTTTVETYAQSHNDWTNCRMMILLVVSNYRLFE